MVNQDLQVVMTLKEEPEYFMVEDCRVNVRSGQNELLITFFEQKVWVNAEQVKLYKEQGSTFCWQDAEKNCFISLDRHCEVCPRCLWWKCPHCGSCGCNKP